MRVKIKMISINLYEKKNTLIDHIRSSYLKYLFFPKKNVSIVETTGSGSWVWAYRNINYAEWKQVLAREQKEKYDINKFVGKLRKSPLPKAEPVNIEQLAKGYSENYHINKNWRIWPHDFDALDRIVFELYYNKETAERKSRGKVNPDYISVKDIGMLVKKTPRQINRILDYMIDGPDNDRVFDSLAKKCSLDSYCTNAKEILKRIFSENGSIRRSHIRKEVRNIMARNVFHLSQEGKKNIAELAEAYKISRSTVYRYIKLARENFSGSVEKQAAVDTAESAKERSGEEKAELSEEVAGKRSQIQPDMRAVTQTSSAVN